MKKSKSKLTKKQINYYVKKWDTPPYKHIHQMMYVDAILYGEGFCDMNISYYKSLFEEIDKQQEQLKHSKNFNKKLNNILK